jgi:hypothetical protein
MNRTKSGKLGSKGHLQGTVADSLREYLPGLLAWYPYPSENLNCNGEYGG